MVRNKKNVSVDGLTRKNSFRFGLSITVFVVLDFRFGFPIPANYDDNGVNCGGFGKQWNKVNKQTSKVYNIIK